VRTGIFTVTAPKGLAGSVVVELMRAIARDLAKDSVPGPCGGRYKARLATDGLEFLKYVLSEKALYVDDYPARDVHPDWLDPDERFVCFVDDILVVRVVR